MPFDCAHRLASTYVESVRREPGKASIDVISTGPAVHIVFEPSFLIMKEIRIGGRVFRLREPIEVNVSQGAGLWIHESKQLSILSYGDSRAAALKSFCEDFSVLWDEIASEADDKLSDEARTLKERFHNIVESVTQVA